jgi:hypothetical protein
MRLSGVIALALVVVFGACGDDPSLHVVVEHPAGLSVDKTVVTVYESPTLTCIDVAFRRIAETDLVPLAVAEETITSSGTVDGELSGISRVDHKVIVARGYDAMGEPLTGGCEEQDVVEGRTKVEIKTRELVTVSLVAPDPADTTDPLRAVVAATDRNGQGVENRRVAWIVYGPSGATPASMTNTEMLADDASWIPTTPACTQKTGPALVHPVPPSKIGGYAVQIGVEWAKALPPMYTNLTSARLDAFPERVTPPASATSKSTRFCAIRISGSTRRLVCLDGTLARDYAVNVSGGGATLTSMQTQSLTGEARVVIAVPSGTDRDVYAVTTRGFLVPLFGAPMPDNRTPVCALAQPCDPVVEDAIAVPACGSQPGRIILRLSTNGAGQLKQMSARGGDLADFPAPVIPATFVELDSAGCVDRFAPGMGTDAQRQVVTYSQGNRNVLDEFVPISTRAAYGCNATSCLHNELLTGAGVAFTEGRMVLTAIDATGVVLVQVVMAPDDTEKDRFVERLRYPSAAVPARIVAGQLDADGDSDLFWNITARRGSSFEVAYARQVGGVPLEALSPAVQVDVADVLIGDLTGTGVDSLVFTESTPLTAATSGIAVVPVNAAAQIPASKPDTSCN